MSLKTASWVGLPMILVIGYFCTFKTSKKKESLPAEKKFCIERETAAVAVTNKNEKKSEIDASQIFATNKVDRSYWDNFDGRLRELAQARGLPNPSIQIDYEALWESTSEMDLSELGMFFKEKQEACEERGDLEACAVLGFLDRSYAINLKRTEKSSTKMARIHLATCAEGIGGCDEAVERALEAPAADKSRTLDYFNRQCDQGNEDMCETLGNGIVWGESNVDPEELQRGKELALNACAKGGGRSCNTLLYSKILSPQERFETLEHLRAVCYQESNNENSFYCDQYKKFTDQSQDNN